MKKSYAICILILILVMINNGYCEETIFSTNSKFSGERFYKYYQYYIKVYEKNKEPSIKEIAGVSIYTCYIKSYVDYCMVFDAQECYIPSNLSHRKVFKSFGKYLENHPIIRKLDIYSVLKYWEIDTYTDKKDKEIGNEVMRQMK